MALPEPKTTNLEEAVKAAGCELEHPKYEGAGHNPDKQFTGADYNTNPPTSGEHSPTWYDDGIYEPGTVPELGKLVHTLEHGRINIQYKAGAPASVVDKLEAFAAGKATRADVQAFLGSYSKAGSASGVTYKWEASGELDPAQVVVWAYEAKAGAWVAKQEIPKS